MLVVILAARAKDPHKNFREASGPPGREMQMSVHEVS